jgi:hypothetical protein
MFLDVFELQLIGNRFSIAQFETFVPGAVNGRTALNNMLVHFERPSWLVVL